MRQWFALRVKSRFEKSVASVLGFKGYEHFLPLYRTRHRWSDRFKSVEVPLFAGYVFCRIEVEQRLPLLMIPGVLHFVGTGKVPMPIDEAEVAAIQAALRSKLPLEPWPWVESGKRIRLESGPLAGLDGILVQTPEQDRVVVSVSVLQRSVAMEISSPWLSPTEGRAVAAPAR